MNEIKEKLLKTNKLRIADGSPAAWKTVHEYEQNDYVEDSDDDKKKRSAESRAMGKKSEAGGVARLTVDWCPQRQVLRRNFPTVVLAGLHLISPFGTSGVQGKPPNHPMYITGVSR